MAEKTEVMCAQCGTMYLPGGPHGADNWGVNGETHNPWKCRDALAASVTRLRAISQTDGANVTALRADLADARRENEELVHAGDALEDSLGEYVRQSMDENPEWRSGVLAWRVASLTAKRRARGLGPRPQDHEVSKTLSSAEFAQHLLRALPLASHEDSVIDQLCRWMTRQLAGRDGDMARATGTAPQLGLLQALDEAARALLTVAEWRRDDTESPAACLSDLKAWARSRAYAAKAALDAARRPPTAKARTA